MLIGLWLVLPLPRQLTDDQHQAVRHTIINGEALPRLPMSEMAPPASPTNIVQPPPPEASEAEKWAWWHAMSEKDPFFEYKMPISFYGQVVDEVGQPVSGATIKLSWTVLSEAGNMNRTVISDVDGLFALEGAVGKRLLIQVSKKGYQQSLAKNRFSFEYAMFADPKYHEPDRAKPVVFVLRKNREAEPLIVRENQEAELMPGQTKSFSIGPNGAAVIIERLADASSGPDGWSARVSVPGGGVALATDEFPFEAPQEGYTSSLDITSTTEKPPVWQGDNGAVLFLKSAVGYGRITVRNTPGMAWVYVTSYFNPKPGSRNLEYDPAKAWTRN